MEGLLLTLSWLFDNGMNFMPHLLVALLIGLAVAVRFNSGPWMIGLTAGLGIAWGALAVSSFNHAPEADPPANGSALETLTFNLHDRNTNYEKAVDYISEADADVVCLQEALGEWRTAVSSLLDLYPHALQSAKGGTILMSKLPLKVRDVNLAAATPYSVAVTVEGLERPVDLLCLHLTRPLSPSKMALRNQEMGHLVRTVFQSKHPVILLGDFNASTRSPALFRFMQQAGLKTSGPGFPPANTWPGGFALFGLRIDHVMFSRQWRLIRDEVGPALGSNHRPLTAELALPADTPDEDAAAAQGN
ncbi:MAG: endonuclease/exonuclease/phosphatase family protein [Alphaproteobacteria bacterium]